MIDTVNYNHNNTKWAQKNVENIFIGKFQYVL